MVTYVGTERPRIIADDLQDIECPRLLNGLHAIPDHCFRCDNRIRACKTRAYRIRDYSGRIITSDFVLT